VFQISQTENATWHLSKAKYVADVSSSRFEYIAAVKCLNLDMLYISEVYNYKATYVAIVKCIKLNILLQSKV